DGAPIQLGKCGKRSDCGSPREARRVTPSKPPCPLDSRRFARFVEREWTLKVKHLEALHRRASITMVRILQTHSCTETDCAGDTQRHMPSRSASDGYGDVPNRVDGDD